jgi:hypothetical protein
VATLEQIKLTEERQKAIKGELRPPLIENHQIFDLVGVLNPSGQGRAQSIDTFALKKQKASATAFFVRPQRSATHASSAFCLARRADKKASEHKDN